MFSALARRLHRLGAAPRLSATEAAALEAGDVWIEADLFSGRPDLRRLAREPWPELTGEERAFLEGPVEEVCRLVDPADVRRTRDLSPEAWKLLRHHRFFGLGLPPEHGGHGFSALAQSTIFGKLASRSLALSSVVLIPNSVGPGELLLEKGTPAQRRHWLPRLARGEEIPCFALTEPRAGSDAAALTSRGVVFRDDAGEIRLRLDWEKRYITLAPISTLLGLAFRLFDPENLLGRGEDVGITCALVPTHLPGVEIGRVHDPMGIPFPNGPTRGSDVVVGLDAVIGGVDEVGHGWTMLMESLSGGRAISLPAQAVAGAKHFARVAGAYARVRRQFGLPIARFEGVEERLGRIAGRAYQLEAVRVWVCGAVGAGRRPAVTSAIVKLATTEASRESAIDAMDVLGGAAICRGPRNLLADAWSGTPIGITVEGANILTRTLIVFGQGALRCHPWAHRLLEAIRREDGSELRRALVGQTVHLVRNLFRLARLELTRGVELAAPAGPTRRLWQRLGWASTRFAVWADLAVFSLGSSLKRRGSLTGRLTDELAGLLLAASALRRWEAEGRLEDDLPWVRWAAERALADAQSAHEAFLANLPGPLAPLARSARWIARAAPVGREPSDRLTARAAAGITSPGPARARLVADLWTPAEEAAPLRVLERAFDLAEPAEAVFAAVKAAVRSGRLAPSLTVEASLEAAVGAGVIDPEPAGIALEFLRAADEALRVDDYAVEELREAEGSRATAPDAVPAVVETV